VAGAAEIQNRKIEQPGITRMKRMVRKAEAKPKLFGEPADTVKTVEKLSG
jgi:hypothetical protein